MGKKIFAILRSQFFFIFPNQNICYGYSKEPSQRDGSFEHPKNLLKLMGKKIFAILQSKLFVYNLNLWLTLNIFLLLVGFRLFSLSLLFLLQLLLLYSYEQFPLLLRQMTGNIKATLIFHLDFIVDFFRFFLYLFHLFF